jgi:hypothetical protein
MHSRREFLAVIAAAVVAPRLPRLARLQGRGPSQRVIVLGAASQEGLTAGYA